MVGPPFSDGAVTLDTGSPSRNSQETSAQFLASGTFALVVCLHNNKNINVRAEYVKTMGGASNQPSISVHHRAPILFSLHQNAVLANAAFSHAQDEVKSIPSFPVNHTGTTLTVSNAVTATPTIMHQQQGAPFSHNKHSNVSLQRQPHSPMALLR